MNLQLIAEILAGETTVTPGGPVDTVTACSLEPFLWERWAIELADEGHPRLAVELVGSGAGQVARTAHGRAAEAIRSEPAVPS